MTLRVLHVHAGTAWGGVESAIETLARLDTDLDHQVALGWDGPVADRLRGRTAVHIVGGVRLSRPWTTLRSRRGLAQLLARDRPDICLMHSTWAATAWAGTVHAAGLPLVLWHHGRPPGGLLGRLARRQHITTHIANSEWTAEGVASVWPDARPRVVHPPAHRDPPTSRGTTRLRLATADDAAVLVTAARWEHGKGQDVLVRAMAAVDRNVPWILWLAGGAHTRAGQRLELMARRIVTQAGLEHRVRFLGHRDDVGDLLAAADLYVQANTTPESFGLSFIEAMAAGVPVVTSDIGAAREVVSATCGVLVPAGDVAALTATVDALLADRARRARLGTAGPARAHDLTDPAHVAAGLDALLREAAGATLSDR